MIVREAIEATLTQAEIAICAGFIRGRAEGDLGRDLALSPGAIAVRACRARKKLRQYLDLA
jgi:DNA-directed RNA polymerase specialized sigma24 family protein